MIASRTIPKETPMRTSRSMLVACSLAALVCVNHAPAQDGAGGFGGSGGSGGSTTPPSIAAALANLQLELNALNTMNDAAGQQLEGARRRTELMSTFVASKNLKEQWTAFSSQWKPTKAPLSFQQAYQTALQAERLRGAVAPSTQDIDTLTNEVAATTSMVQKQWSSLNAARRQVHAMAAFLDANKLMDAYHDFATAQAKAMQAAEATRAAQQSQMEKDREAKEQSARNAALNFLQKQWDAQDHSANSGVDYNFQFSQSYSQASQFSQSPGSAGSAGTPTTPGSGPPQPVPTAYDYWTGTYFNGYADPYYDIYGSPVASGYGQWGGAGAYNRTNPAAREAAATGRR